MCFCSSHSMTPRRRDSAEQEGAPLLRNEHWHGRDHYDNDEPQLISFDEDDDENPKNWALRWKYIQVAQVTIIGRTLPLSSPSSP